jgi:hypothetical protein
MSQQFNQIVMFDLEKTITEINKHNININGVTRLKYLNDEQRNKFINIVRKYYESIVNAVNSNASKIKYSAAIQKFMVPVVVSRPYGDNTREVFCKLSIDQFVQAIVDAVIIGLFRLEGQVFFTTYADKSSALVDDQILKGYYPYIISYLYNDITAVPGLATQLREFASELATKDLPVSPVLNPEINT